MMANHLQVLQNSSVRVAGVLPLHSFAPVFPRNLLPASGRESWHGWPSGLVWLTHGSPSLPSRAGIVVRRGTGRDGAGEAKGSHRLANQQGSIKCLVQTVLARFPWKCPFWHSILASIYSHSHSKISIFILDLSFVLVPPSLLFFLAWPDPGKVSEGNV